MKTHSVQGRHIIGESDRDLFQSMPSAGEIHFTVCSLFLTRRIKEEFAARQQLHPELHLNNASVFRYNPRRPGVQITSDTSIHNFEVIPQPPGKMKEVFGKVLDLVTSPIYTQAYVSL